MFEKRCSRIRLKLNLMDVIIIYEVEFKAYATAVILCVSSVFWYSASEVLTQNV